MISAETILQSLPLALKDVSLTGLGEKQSGKVRDFYVNDGQRVLVTTDRQSAFDVNLGHIPFKGAVLNQLAAFWFEQTKDIVPNHLIAVPDPNVTIARECVPITIEMIVRGYMSGVTNTSIWGSYALGDRVIYGLTFPDGLSKNQRLERPIITPTTHGGGVGGHDERLTRAEILERELVDPGVYARMERTALALFDFGARLCLERGLILVDTKYEFGLVDGELVIMDEMHTPDSSRFWRAATFETRIAAGQEPENVDKEFLRLWFKERGYSGDGEPPAMNDELIVALSSRYIEVFETITGTTFKAFDYPV
jgi:phosphoribosylaminoimidazole-succinocarboxamide synthase